MDQRNRYAGCLLAGAAGDALGAPVEFSSLDEIRACYGPEGITAFDEIYGGKGLFTDDTQMTLFTAEGLLRGYTRELLMGESASYAFTVDNAYQRWLRTQVSEQETGRAELIDPQQPGWLIHNRNLHNVRSPGATCLSALQSKQSLGALATNDSKGCGSVMRIAPVGLFVLGCSRQGNSPYDRQTAYELGCHLGGLTHGHVTGQSAAGAFAVMIYALASGNSIGVAVEQAINAVESDSNPDTAIIDAIREAQAMASAAVGACEGVEKLGGGWVAEEAVAIAVYCVLATNGCEQAIVAAVNHGGDSDSTGAMTGHLAGAFYGMDALPDTWVGQLELVYVLAQIADDLHDCHQWRSCEYDSHVMARVFEHYPAF